MIFHFDPFTFCNKTFQASQQLGRVVGIYGPGLRRSAVHSPIQQYHEPFCSVIGARRTRVMKGPGLSVSDLGKLLG